MSPAHSQSPAQPKPPASETQPAPRFSFADVQRRAREMAGAPLAPAPALPESLRNLDVETWRDIRSRADRALLANAGGDFRLQPFHLGGPNRQPVTINILRDGIAAPIPYNANLFDYGKLKFERPLPVNLGFAGFRLTYPTNQPNVFDTLLEFPGGSRFRFLGRGQRAGVTAHALIVDPEATPEATFFREFWVETPAPGAVRATLYAVLDGESVSGAYKFEMAPGVDAGLQVTASLYARRPDLRLGVAPLSSMYFYGERERPAAADFRPQAHVSDGLALLTSGEEAIWRPLQNPAAAQTSTWDGASIRGFGLLQRERRFEQYQDLDRAYEQCPSYWVAPTGDWGGGRVELRERPASDESAENIFACWTPGEAPTPGKPLNLAYSITSTQRPDKMIVQGRADHTFVAPAAARSRRFVIDFSGGELAYYQNAATTLELATATSAATVTNAVLTPNPHIKGFRASFDVSAPGEGATEIRAWLQVDARVLTETWNYAWRSPG